MALSHDWILQSASVLWILTLLLGESHSKRTQTYYMEGVDCDDVKTLGGAIVFSHHFYRHRYYNHSVECTLYFRAQNRGWKLMLHVLELDIPDRRNNGICNDALYIYDADNIYTMPLLEAGGNNGLCGNKIPSTFYSKGEFFTVHFRTNSRGKRGNGFKFVITAYSDDYEKHESCGSSFLCENKKCIDEDLVCDKVDHCGDYTDESSDGKALCGVEDNGIFAKFLELGVAASIAIFVGSVVLVIVCIVACICCCRKSCCRTTQNTSGTTSTATSVVANGAPAYHHGNGHAQIDRGHNFHPHPMSPFNNQSHQGYFPMQAMYPSPHGSMYSGSGYTRDHYGHASSAYSSQPPSHHRSYTPTSSKSGKSNRSNNSVPYSHSTDKVMLPVNL